jgi:hypothetical protein
MLSLITTIHKTSVMCVLLSLEFDGKTKNTLKLLVG